MKIVSADCSPYDTLMPFFLAQPSNDPGQMSNGTPSAIQQQSYYQAPGNAPPLGTGQQGVPTTTNQQMIQRAPQQNDQHFPNQPIHHPMNQPQ